MRKEESRIVLSASRRTDIPAFYMDWFTARLEHGSVEIVNPYNRKMTIVDVRPDRVHSIVFWSKNYGPFLKGSYGERLMKMGYSLFFNFTLNSRQILLEPGIPSLESRLNQLDELSLRFGSGNIYWRFDPICFFRVGNGPIKNNLNDFPLIADRAGDAGILTCITSFMDQYNKVRRRINHPDLEGFSFVEESFEHQLEILLEMEKSLAYRGISLSICCEKELFKALPGDSRILPSSCIPTPLLVTRFGGNPSLKADPGQRKEKGCGCFISTDVGSYRSHPCLNECLYCYANPSDHISNHYIPKERGAA
ncbi:MAG: DUF1848 family protein [Thermodesulfobacteriota bacterium]